MMFYWIHNCPTRDQESPTQHHISNNLQHLRMEKPMRKRLRFPVNQFVIMNLEFIRRPSSECQEFPKFIIFKISYFFYTSQGSAPNSCSILIYISLSNPLYLYLQWKRGFFSYSEKEGVLFLTGKTPYMKIY